MSSSRFYYGDKAVKKVKELYPDCVLTKAHELLIHHEGFCEGVYTDDKGVLTTGVGQTKEYFNMPFPDVFNIFLQKAKDLTPNFDSLSEELKAAIVSATYRGDWQLSKKTRQLFNLGKYQEAADEFLNNKEYRERLLKETKDGVVKRLEYIADCIRKGDCVKGDRAKGKC
jgi:GH24 family phage-related lysozyme (muramidase)